MQSVLSFLLPTFGSAGDLMPLLSVGQSLRERGHTVTVLTGGGFGDVIRRSGLDSVPLTPPSFFERSLRDAFLLNTRYRGLYLRRYAVTWNAALLHYLGDVSKADTILLGAERPLLWADLCAHLQHGISCVRLVTDLLPAPGLAPRDHVVNPLQQAALAAGWQGDWSRAVEPLGIRPGHRHVDRLKLASSRSVPRLGLWPDWIAATGSRVAGLKNFGFVGSPRLTSETAFVRPAGLRRLLVFMAGTQGTTGNWEQRFAAVSQKVCENLDCDGLLLGGNPPDGAKVTDSFIWLRHVPLDSVLPSATALIHHGGIGTAAAALQHGIPQLIVPRMFSQPSNAHWMRRAGVAQVLAPEEYYPEEATQGVQALLSDQAVPNACRTWQAKINPEADRERVCDFVESWHRRRAGFQAQPIERVIKASA